MSIEYQDGKCGKFKPLPGAQLNDDHPLVEGLIGYWLLNENRGIKEEVEEVKPLKSNLIDIPIDVQIKAFQSIKVK